MRPVVVVLATAQRRGAELQGLALGETLASRGHAVTTLALERGGGTQVLDVPVLGRSARSPATISALRGRLGDAVVIAHGSMTLPATALATVGRRNPWVYRSIGDPAAWVRGRLHRERAGLMIRRADVVVTLWDGASAAMRELYRMPAGRITVIPNSRDGSRFPPVTAEERVAARAELGLDGPVVLYLGALSEEKRPLAAVQAIASIPEATLVIAGVGPLAGPCEELAQLCAPGRVRLVGETHDPSHLLAAVDVLVLPSRTEGMPGVVIEAQLRGVPVVASAVGAVPQMIDHGVDGFLVAADDPVALVAALRRVIERPGEFAHRSEDGARQRYERLVVHSRWEAVLEELSGRER